MPNPFAQYKQNSILTMSSGEQIIALYDGITKNIGLTVQLYKANDYKTADVCTKKAKDIVDYLILSLNFDIPMSNDLFNLYNFFKEQIIKAEMQHLPEPLVEIAPLVTELKSAWVEASKSTHINK